VGKKLSRLFEAGFSTTGFVFNDYPYNFLMFFERKNRKNRKLPQFYFIRKDLSPDPSPQREGRVGFSSPCV
jgi:hypothetical protein